MEPILEYNDFEIHWMWIEQSVQLQKWRTKEKRKWKIWTAIVPPISLPNRKVRSWFVRNLETLTDAQKPDLMKQLELYEGVALHWESSSDWITACIERIYWCGEQFAKFSSESLNGRLEWGLWLGKSSWNLWRESLRSSETCYMKTLRKRSADNAMIPEVVDLQVVTRISNWDWGDEETEHEALVLRRDKTYRLNNSVTLFWWIFLSHQTTTAACLVEE